MRTGIEVWTQNKAGSQKASGGRARGGQRESLAMKCVLAIAGSDPLGSAGVQADIKAAAALGVHAAAVITSVTAQNSRGLKGVQWIAPQFIKAQAQAVIEQVVPDAVKIGMLGTGEAIVAVAEILEEYHLSPVVLDPVLKASGGGNLLDPGAVDVLKSKLLPLVDVVTPNIAEAEALSGRRIQGKEGMLEAAQRIAAMGVAVVVTGGHLDASSSDLVYESGKFIWVEGQRLPATNTRGTGCVFSTAMACYMANGKNVFEATKRAHEFVRFAIMYSYPLGKGKGPINPLGDPSRKAFVCLHGDSTC